MTNPKALLDHFGVLPKKSLGQNFLHDPQALEKIADAAELMPDETVLEIGPGTGALTAVLAGRVRQVYAVELDRRLEPIMRLTLAPHANVTVIFDDIMSVNLPELLGDQPYVVVANVPYYITSAILRLLLEGKNPPKRIILTVQLEVAERLIAKPGDMTLLSVSAQFYAKPKIVARFNKAVFYPRPDIDSAVIRLDVYDAPPVAVPSADQFFRVVKAGFGQKRKQLKNSLAEGLHIDHDAAAVLLESAGIDPKRRAETLSLAEWAALTRAHAGNSSDA
ncbi:MAG: ribosomal RNA small subunit methyltransferase A [Anaerolinea sp.]|nr:ribosomal RNA small subunit methyltransferase A [Anaerolinea sp.]